MLVMKVLEVLAITASLQLSIEVRGKLSTAEVRFVSLLFFMIDAVAGCQAAICCRSLLQASLVQFALGSDHVPISRHFRMNRMITRRILVYFMNKTCRDQMHPCRFTGPLAIRQAAGHGTEQ